MRKTTTTPSAQSETLHKNPGLASWADVEFQFVKMDLATIWNFHSVCYRDDLVQLRLKSEQLNFGLY